MPGMIAVYCPGCGAKSWATSDGRCRDCDAVLQRCVDCACYHSARGACRCLGLEIDQEEAEHPTMLAVSTQCREYLPIPARKAA